MIIIRTMSCLHRLSTPRAWSSSGAPWIWFWCCSCWLPWALLSFEAWCEQQHFILNTSMIPTNHIWDLLDKNAVLSTLCRQLWILHWTPALSTLSTMSPTWRTLLASPVSWWPLHFSPRLRSSALAASYYRSLIHLQTTSQPLEHSVLLA